MMTVALCCMMFPWQRVYSGHGPPGNWLWYQPIAWLKSPLPSVQNNPPGEPLGPYGALVACKLSSKSLDLEIQSTWPSTNNAFMPRLCKVAIYALQYG